MTQSHTTQSEAPHIQRIGTRTIEFDPPNKLVHLQLTINHEEMDNLEPAERQAYEATVQGFCQFLAKAMVIKRRMYRLANIPVIIPLTVITMKVAETIKLIDDTTIEGIRNIEEAVAHFYSGLPEKSAPN